MSLILETEQLTKKYGKLWALNGFSLKVESGQVMGILGPNGSGKTTTLGIILGALRATSGSFRWFGHEPRSVDRRKIGSLLETPNFLPYLSLINNLKIVCDIKQVQYSDIPRVLEIVELKERARSFFKNLSFGMKQRLALAAGLLGDPDILILDEPTNGLDPEGIHQVRDLILKLSDQKKTIILASHMLDEVEKVCSHVAILKHGDLLASGAVGELLGDQLLASLKAEDMAALEAALKENRGVEVKSNRGGQIEVVLASDYQPQDLNRDLFKKNIVLSHMNVHRRDLESEFLEVTRNA